MVTLSSSVVAAGVRANTFVRYYETVASMLAATESVSEGQQLQVKNHRYIVAASAAADHHLTRGDGVKLYVQRNAGKYELLAFGAALDGVTDDTTIFVEAVQVAAAENVPLVIEGSLVFDPTQIVWQQQNQHIWHVSGQLKPTTTIEVNDKIFHLEGFGGAGKGTFWLDYGCEIIPPAGDIATLRLKGLSFNTVKNVLIGGAYIAIHLQNGAWKEINSCAISAGNTGKHGLLIDDCFWVWVRDCSIRSSSTLEDGWSIFVGDLDSTGAYSGLLYFEDCTTKGRGMMFDNTIGESTDKTRTVDFVRHTHESTPAGDYTVTAKNLRRVFFDRFTDADPIGGALGTFNLPDVGVAYFQSFSVAIEGAKPNYLIVNGVLYDGWDGIGQRPGQQASQSGLLFARPAWRAYSPFITTGIGEPLNLSFAASGQGDVAYAGSVAAPDGSATAFTLTNNGAGSGEFEFFDANVTMNDGDIIIGGVFCKSTPVGQKSLIYSQIEGDPAAVYRGGDLEVATYRSDSLGDDARGGLLVVNWLPLNVVHQMVSHPGSGTSLQIRFVTRISAGLAQTFWHPWLRVLRAADGYTWDDALRVVSANGYIQNNLPEQTTALPAHHMLMTGKGVTGSRPANPVAGCQWYDTTLGKPIWYDGTNWTDAAGTTV